MKQLRRSDIFSAATVGSNYRYIKNIDSNKTESLKLLEKMHPSFYRTTFVDFIRMYPEYADIEKIAKELINNFSNHLKNGTCLKFSGGSKAGKTMLASIIYQEIIKLNFKVGYENLFTFLKKIHELNPSPISALYRAINYYRKTDLLIIDDISEYDTEMFFSNAWRNKFLESLINIRSREKLCSILIGKSEIIENIKIENNNLLT